MIQRVNGSLAVSRALGDYEYKVSLMHYFISDFMTNMALKLLSY